MITHLTTRVLRVLGALLLPLVLVAQGTSGFPHADHAPLFPSCTGCHAGVTTGDPATTFPAAVQCRACHDGKEHEVVAFAGRATKSSGLLRFSHPVHSAKAAAGHDTVTCASCHARQAGAAWMDIARATPERCSSCHQHRATAHLADGNACATCHRPLADVAGLTDADIARLPKPPSHARTDFLAAHAPVAHDAAASCSTCHARESCARCHANSAGVPLIAALKNDARVARLVAGKAPAYPTPADHGRNGFAESHGRAAMENVARCANCHSQASCQTCHTGVGARTQIALLPSAREAAGRGVLLQRPVEQVSPLSTAAPATKTAATIGWVPAPHASDSARRTVRVHRDGFVRTHGVGAAADPTSCQGCHALRFCADCHKGEKVTRRYHQANFVSLHSTSAYGRGTDCATCHNTEVFCRSCHNSMGVGTGRGGIRGVGFHNAQPQWMFQHGRAARQDLGSCVSCHQQRDCQQCHSQLGWRINPHGPGFDAERLGGKNKAMCLRCHFKDPLLGR